jgi:cytochrome b6-f complex iron-sulfur subunit
MLAAARAQKKNGDSAAAAAPLAKPKTDGAAKPAAATAKASPKAAPAAVASGPKDTGSILAEARNPSKPGPMSKAEAALKAPADKAAPKPAKPRIPVPPMPAKPEYAKPKAPREEAEEGRRSFLMGVLLGSFFAMGNVAMATTFGLWTLGTARFMFPNVLTEPPNKFKVGFPSSFTPGQVETKFVPQYGVWVVNWEYNGKPEIYALRTVCTHLGCTPNWLEGEQKFKCPCHGSGFYKDGINFEGPAPRPLERYAIRIADDGQLEIDKSKIFQEEIGQWNDPASYVVV